MNKIKDLKLKKKKLDLKNIGSCLTEDQIRINNNNALKMSVFEVIMVRISPH